MEGLDCEVGAAGCESSQDSRTSEDHIILYFTSSHTLLACNIQCGARDKKDVLTQGQIKIEVDFQAGTEENRNWA